MRWHRFIFSFLLGGLLLAGSGCGGYGAKDVNQNKDQPKTPEKTVQ